MCGVGSFIHCVYSVLSLGWIVDNAFIFLRGNIFSIFFSCDMNFRIRYLAYKGKGILPINLILCLGNSNNPLQSFVLLSFLHLAQRHKTRGCFGVFLLCCFFFFLGRFFSCNDFFKLYNEKTKPKDNIMIVHITIRFFTKVQKMVYL